MHEWEKRWWRETVAYSIIAFMGLAVLVFAWVVVI